MDRTIAMAAGLISNGNGGEIVGWCWRRFRWVISNCTIILSTATNSSHNVSTQKQYKP